MAHDRAARLAALGVVGIALTPEARMIFLALAAGVVAHLLEAAAYSPLLPSLIDVDHMSQAHIDSIRHSLRYQALAIPEELLEMAGALLFAVAFARVLSRRAPAATKMARRYGRRQAVPD